MRRSGSSSCMLRPKSSLSSEDLQKMQEEPPLTVTMVNTTRLASYSTERYYMLSELEQNASAMEFVCDLPSSLENVSDTINKKQQASSDAHADTSSSTEEEQSPILTSHVILYILWRPNTYPSPRAFVEGPVMDNVKRILELGGDDVDTLFEAAAPPSPPSTSPLNQQYGSSGDGTVPPPGSTSTMGRRASFGRGVSLRDSAKGLQIDTRTKVYVCVDRLSPPPTVHDSLAPNNELSEVKESEQDGIGMEGEQNVRAAAQASVDNQARRLRQHAVETQIAEGVSKTISTHPILRGIVEGVSVGTTAEVRAAPGLEVCLKAITHGSGERRRQARTLQRGILGGNRDAAGGQKKEKKKVDPIRSPICLVAPHPDDVVGLDPEGEADAVQGIIQSITVAEWNGNGDAVCFASRAMDAWRKAHGLEIETASISPRTAAARTKRKISRRASSDSSNYGDDAEDIAQTMVVAFMIAAAAFLWTKYRESIWAALFQFLQRIYER